MQCNFDNADFRGFKLGAFHGCTFHNADLTDAEFVKTKLQDHWYYFKRTDPTFYGRTYSFFGSVYRRGFIDCPITRKQFEDTKTYKSKDLSQMGLLLINFDQWNFRDCNLDDSALALSSLKDADFTNASIQKTDFSNTNITREQWLSTKTFRGVKKFMPPTTHGVDLSHYDFSGMTIQSVVFQKVNLKNADFSGTTMKDCSFLGGDLTDANFTNATLENVYFGCSLAWKQFLSTRNGKTGDFSKIGLGHASFKGWNFSNADLSGKRFEGCDFPDCNFDNATIDVHSFGPARAKYQSEEVEEYMRKGLTREQFMSTANYRSKVLYDAYFGSDDDIRGMDFSRFDLTDTEFRYVDFTDVRLDDATIKKCTFYAPTQPKRIPLTKEQFYSTTTYKSGTVEGVTFYNMDFTGWDFSKVKLVNCKFYDGCVGVPALY